MLTLNPQRLPGQLPETRLDELTTKIKQGTISKEEKEELTSGFIKLASHIARSLGGSNYTRVEDYFSCGLFGIAYAIHHAKERLVDQNIAAWIIYQIKDHIKRFRQADHPVPVPPSTYTKAKREGRTLPVAPAVHALGTAEPCSILGNVFELRDIIELCAKDNDDRTIIRLRSHGYKDDEISEMTGIPRSTVNSRRNAIEVRFDAMLNEEL